MQLLRALLLEIPGVTEAEVLAQDGAAYLKIDADITSESEVDEFLRGRM